ncbi:hypothetical protein ACJW31_11G033700 [Castanea mollissima]
MQFSLSLFPNSVLSISLFGMMSMRPVDTNEIFPPARSPSQSPPRLSVSIETFFHPTRSPSQSDSSGNYEEIFPTDPFISTSSRCTFGGPRTVVTQVTFNNARTQFLQIAVRLHCDGCRVKAKRTVLRFSGVQSASIKGQDKDQIEVQGEGIDTVKLVTLLRKRLGRASIVSDAEEKKEEKEDEKKDELKIQNMIGSPSNVLTPYALYNGIRGYENDTPSCSRM